MDNPIRAVAGKYELTYYLRAATSGPGHVLPAVAHPLYDEKDRGDSAADVITTGHAPGW